MTRKNVEDSDREPGAKIYKMRFLDDNKEDTGQHSPVSLSSQFFDTKKTLLIHSCSQAAEMDTGLDYSPSVREIIPSQKCFTGSHCNEKLKLL